jgi:Tetratricopeptide repeat
LERHGDAHLTSDELDAVMRSRGALGAYGPGEGDVTEARQHLSACSICRLMVNLHAEQEGRMGQLRVAVQAERGSECPEESEWPLVAAGMKQGGQAEALLRHAAACDHCGPLLRQYAEDFAEDLTAEEQTTLGGFRSSRAGWQEQMAAKLCNPRRTGSIGAWLREHLVPAPRVPRWAYAASLASLAVVSFVGRVVFQQRPIEALLATAYTEQRTLELRIPKAAYGPVRLVRGSGDRSRLDRPPALLEGVARIARELEKNPASPALLQAMGRANLLDWDYQAAIASFERALKLQPDSPTLMADLASAYFERAEANHNAAGYGAAADLLSRALKAAPDDPVALFNRAIIYERMHLYDQSIQDWQRYLRVDSGSSWAPEARKRLADVERRK